MAIANSHLRAFAAICQAADEGNPITIRRIMKKLKLKSTKGVWDVLRRLEAVGLISRDIPEGEKYGSITPLYRLFMWKEYLRQDKNE